MNLLQVKTEEVIALRHRLKIAEEGKTFRLRIVDSVMHTSRTALFKAASAESAMESANSLLKAIGQNNATVTEAEELVA